MAWREAQTGTCPRMSLERVSDERAKQRMRPNVFLREREMNPAASAAAMMFDNAGLAGMHRLGHVAANLLKQCVVVVDGSQPPASHVLGSESFVLKQLARIDPALGID